MCNYIYKELSCQHHYHLVESWCPKYIETERRCPPTIVSKQYWGDDICDTCNVHLFATDRGELRPSELCSTVHYSPVDAMHRTSTFTLISTLDATPPASGATPMIICMRGLMTVIRAAYYEATPTLPLGLISREEKKKEKQPNHIWHEKES
ncbi:hypothetical protein FANTH_12927 [Fusarium anthophilum]|uniref:Uncharacterized protein n=1 Tax=Fusarium anthophilum TaxID=48485 RepID=A0A8H4YQV7_9HYPO|nr:hypothetical protein FANTH_12927 [Fusarium anthophilum]